MQATSVSHTAHEASSEVYEHLALSRGATSSGFVKGRVADGKQLFATIDSGLIGDGFRPRQIKSRMLFRQRMVDAGFGNTAAQSRKDTLKIGKEAVAGVKKAFQLIKDASRPASGAIPESFHRHPFPFDHLREDTLLTRAAHIGTPDIGRKQRPFPTRASDLSDPKSDWYCMEKLDVPPGKVDIMDSKVLLGMRYTLTKDQVEMVKQARQTAREIIARGKARLEGKIAQDEIWEKWHAQTRAQLARLPGHVVPPLVTTRRRPSIASFHDPVAFENKGMEQPGASSSRLRADIRRALLGNEFALGEVEGAVCVETDWRSIAKRKLEDPYVPVVVEVPRVDSGARILPAEGAMLEWKRKADQVELLSARESARLQREGRGVTETERLDGFYGRSFVPGVRRASHNTDMHAAYAHPDALERRDASVSNADLYYKDPISGYEINGHHHSQAKGEDTQREWYPTGHEMENHNYPQHAEDHPDTFYDARSEPIADQYQHDYARNGAYDERRGYSHSSSEEAPETLLDYDAAGNTKVPDSSDRGEIQLQPQLVSVPFSKEKRPLDEDDELIELIKRKVKPRKAEEAIETEPGSFDAKQKVIDMMYIRNRFSRRPDPVSKANTETPAVPSFAPRTAVEQAGLWRDDPMIANESWYTDAAQANAHARQPSISIIASLPFLQRAWPLCRALQQAGVDVIDGEREGISGADLAICPSSAVLCRPLSTLPVNYDDLLQDLKTSASFYADVYLFMEVKPFKTAREDSTVSAEDTGPLTPAIARVIPKLRRAVALFNDCDAHSGKIRMAFTSNGAEVARIIKNMASPWPMDGEEVEPAAEWLDESQGDNETALEQHFALNLYAARVILRYLSPLDRFILHTSTEEKYDQLVPLIGPKLGRRTAKLFHAKCAAA